MNFGRDSLDLILERLTAIEERLCRLGASSASVEAKVDKLMEMIEDQQTKKDWYSTAEVAKALKKSEFTVREWCRLGQCKAVKQRGYRGGKKQWMIPHEEMVRLEREGPVPVGTHRLPSAKY